MKTKSYCALITVAGLTFAAAMPCQAVVKTVMVSSKAAIAPVLELTVSQQGSSEIKFGNIAPSAIDATVAGPITVQIDVTCNTGERYQVTQQMNGPLQNADGTKIDYSRLTFKSTGTKTNGTPVPKLTAVAGSAQVIFTSNLTGESDRVAADYYLNVPPSQEPGNYSAYMTYTVSAL